MLLLVVFEHCTTILGVTDNLNINYDDNLIVCTDDGLSTMIGADQRLELTDTELI